MQQLMRRHILQRVTLFSSFSKNEQNDSQPSPSLLSWAVSELRGKKTVTV